MKIGILTFINTLNYGASLQALALQETIKKMGYDAEVLQYINEIISNDELNKGDYSLRGLYKSLIMGRGLKKKRIKFENFENKYITKGIEFNHCKTDEVNDKYDAFVAGSDQIWNMRISRRDWIYFLSFVKNDHKKISYAASFGNDAFPSECKQEASYYLKKFNKLSIREESGKKLIQDISDREARVVLDPTMLLSKKEWDRFITPLCNIPKEYILVYFPHNKKKVFEFVDKLKTITNIPVIYLSISPRIQVGVKTIYDASPGNFLWLIKNATYVVTGSFHGTAFSLLFNKQFFYEPSGKGSRIDNLVSLTDTNCRTIEEKIDLNNRLNYEYINEILQKHRVDSIEWLRDSLFNSTNYGDKI